MINSQVKNIFSKLKVEEICISVDSKEVGKVPLFEDFNNAFKSFSGKALRAFELVGEHTVMFLLEDTKRIMSALKKNPDFITRNEPDWINELGYKVIMIDEIEKFNPASGYLYNILKNDKKSNFIIYRTFQKPIGITNYDIAVKKLNRKMNIFY